MYIERKAEGLSGPGVNSMAFSTYMGHSSIKITFDLYGHWSRATRARRRRT